MNDSLALALNAVRAEVLLKAGKSLIEGGGPPDVSIEAKAAIALWLETIADNLAPTVAP